MVAQLDLKEADNYRLPSVEKMLEIFFPTLNLVV